MSMPVDPVDHVDENAGGAGVPARAAFAPPNIPLAIRAAFMPSYAPMTTHVITFALRLTGLWLLSGHGTLDV